MFITARTFVVVLALCAGAILFGTCEPAAALGQPGEPPDNGFCHRGEPMPFGNGTLCIGCGDPGEPCCRLRQPRCNGIAYEWACFAGPGDPIGICGRREPRDWGAAGCGFPGHPLCRGASVCQSGLPPLHIAPGIDLCVAAGWDGQRCRASRTHPCDGRSTCRGGYCIPGEDMQEWCRKVAVDIDAAIQTRDANGLRAAVENACVPPCPFCQQARANMNNLLNQWAQVPPSPYVPPLPPPGIKPPPPGVKPPPPVAGAWHLKRAHAETYKPLNPKVRISPAKVDASSGSANVQHEIRTGCWETYELSWTLARDIRTLRRGDRVGVTLNSRLTSASCGSVLGTYLAVEGPPLEDFLVRLAPPGQIEQGVFRPQGPRAEANSSHPSVSTRNEVEVLTNPPATGNPKTAFMRFYLYAPGQFAVVAYVFEAGP
jgi:hypothetical protein